MAFDLRIVRYAVFPHNDKELTFNFRHATQAVDLRGFADSLPSSIDGGASTRVCKRDSSPDPFSVMSGRGVFDRMSRIQSGNNNELSVGNESEILPR